MGREPDLTADVLAARSRWQYTGALRPDFAVSPGQAQESVWDYPRPPRIEPDSREVVVRSGDQVLARTRSAVRVLETASPPTFYLPPSDVETDLLASASGGSLCEWKGEAVYHQLVSGPDTGVVVAWSYPEPFPEFASIRGWYSFYPALLDCRVDDEPVLPQPGRFYGGWVTLELVGPFKGEHGSEDW
jgi:uncharacterized protein (DUF427 family)